MRFVLVLPLVLLLATWSNAYSGLGMNGINSLNLKLPDGTDLTGAGIGIGQVEGYSARKIHYERRS